LFLKFLSGEVTDPTGAVVPNASVRAINTATNESREVKTTSLGVYTIPYLIPGTYHVGVSAPGFQASSAKTLFCGLHRS